MADDYGSRYTSAYPFPLSANNSRLYSGSLSGSIGPDDTSDEDWFKVSLLKGATYEFSVIGGPEVYDLNDAKITWYKPNGSSTIANWYFDQARSDGYVYDSGIITTSEVGKTDDYYIRVDLDPYGDALDVGEYDIRVEQLSEGFTTYLTQSLASTMTDDYGSRYTSAYTFPLSANGSGLASGSLTGVIGPDDNNDEDWFKVRLQKGATYEFTVAGGSEVYDLNDSKITWYKPNGSSTIANWYFDQSRDDGYVYDNGIYTTSPITSTDDYYIKVDLDPYGDSLDVGQYTMSVEQLTPGFAAPAPTPVPTPTAAPLPTSETPTPGGQRPTKPGAAAGPTVINNYYTTNNNTNTANNTNNNTNTTINNTGKGNVKTGNIGTVENNTYVDNSFELRSVSIDLSTAISGESKKNETIAGTSGDDLIAAGDGKDTLEGDAGADRFYFSGNEAFKKSKADQVVDFDTKEGDQIIIADQIFFNPIITNSVLKDLSSNPDVAVANSKKDLNDMSREDHDFVYYRPKGELYIDTNDAEQGFADQESSTDPLIANLDKKEKLTPESLDSIADTLEEDMSSDPEFAVVGNKKELKKASKEGFDLLYYEPKGDLYIDGNGDTKGLGNKIQGGMIADLPNDTSLDESNILIGE